MVYQDVSKLDDLCIRVDGLASMSLVIRDCVVEGPNSADSYEDAVDLFATLMCDFKNGLNETAKEIFSKLDNKTV